MNETSIHFSPNRQRGTPVVIRLHEKDNVAVAMSFITDGTHLDALHITAIDDIGQGHKIALQPIKSGEHIIKYGQIIGIATADIAVGNHVHIHNLSMAQFNRDYAHAQFSKSTDYVAADKQAFFMGYKRPDGRCGTRNYIGIITSVNCSASVAKMIAAQVQQSGLLAQYPHVDGVVPIVHGAGCCIATDDEPFYKLQRAIWGYATHPNFAAVLLVGLGCESNQISAMLEKYGKPLDENFSHFTIQQAGGTRKTIAEGVERIKAMLMSANQIRRQQLPASELTVALQCGGSDGFSGITANPALGAAVDQLVAHGGTAALAETPEIYGAEHLLTRRAQSVAVGESLTNLINWWEEYANKNNATMNNNPTPGNKHGGITTILEKSLGAVAKAGSSNLTGVYRYGELITTRGMVFVDSPGYDPVSLTGQVASGCNIICFTTGRGSCYGNKPVPTIKIATNTTLYNHMIDDMDINCGTIAEGQATVEQSGDLIFNQLLAVASGNKTKSEQLGVGDAEFAPWQTYAQM